MKKIILIFTVLFVGFLLLPNIIFSQWKKVNAPVHSQCFAIQNNNIIVGTPDSGVFISTDNGIIWNQVNNGLPGLYISDIFAINENLFSIVNGKNSNLYFSTNNGAEWIEVNNELTENHQSIASHIASDGKVIVSTRGPYGSIYYSKDNCETWIKSSGYDSSIYYIDLFFASGTNIFALEGIGNDIYLSTNDGMSWTKIESDVAFNKKINDDGVITISGIGGNLFLGTGDGIYISTNNGVNWLEEDSKLAGLEVNTFFVSDTNIIAGTSNGAYLSTNDGINWSEINYGFDNNNPNIIKFNFMDKHIYASNGGYGIRRCSVDDILSTGFLENPGKFSDNKDYGLYYYVEKEYEFNRKNKIKTKKYDYIKEYINKEGEIEKIEYFSDDGVWSTLYFRNANDRIYYNEMGGLFGNIDDYMEIDGSLMVTKRYPGEQTTIWIQYVFNYNGQINVEILTDEGSKRSMGVYLYNQGDKIDKIYNYVFFYKNENLESEYFEKETDIYSLMLLSSIETFKYDDSGKLLCIEKSNIQDNKTEIISIEYNDRGHRINDYYKGIVEYEYYDESELNDYKKDIKK